MTTPLDDDLDIDESAVLRSMEGDKSFPLNTDEIRAVCDRLHARGMPDTEIADRLGTSPLNVSLWRKRQVMPLSLAAGRGSKSTGRPGSASPRPVPAPSPPPGPPVTGGGAEPSIDALVNAAARSASKRTQALGVKLAEVASVVRQRLREERDAAEKAQREKAVRDAATAEVARLEAELAEARAKLVGGRRSKGVGSAAQVQSARNAAATAVAKAEASGPYVCQKGCGREFGYPGPRGSHEKRCTGGAK